MIGKGPLNTTTCIVECGDNFQPLHKHIVSAVLGGGDINLED